jgi:hypothetical protein
MGKIVGKPSISLKMRQIPSNFIFFAIFGGKCKLTSMQLAYLHGINSVQLMCVHGIAIMNITCVHDLSIQWGMYMFQKIYFLRRSLNNNLSNYVSGKANAMCT